MIPQEKLDQVIKHYIQKCKQRTQVEFANWRLKIIELIKKNYYDERLNLRQPMSMNRIVWTLDEIDYDI